MRWATTLVAMGFIGGGCAPDPTSSAAETGDCFDGCCYGAVVDANGFRCSPEWVESGDGRDVSGDGSEEADTGEERPTCGRSVLDDGDFEQGTPSVAWDEFSPLFGTPICDANCSVDAGAVPFAGDWFAWFGGAQEPSVASLTQSFSVSADAAQLVFQFAIDQASGSADDTFAVLVDGNTVFMRTGADMDGFEDYVPVTLTLDQWADGAPHELRMESEVFGGGLTNFFVDDVALVGCGNVDDAGVDDTGADDPDADDTGDTGAEDPSTGGSGTGSGSGSTGADGTGSGSDSEGTGSAGTTGGRGSGSGTGTATGDAESSG